MIYLKKYYPQFLIVVLSIFGLLPLFHAGFFPIHDNEQIGRLFELNKVLLSGHIPPRLAPDLGFGYDYPLWNFYPPLVYYIALVFHLFGFSLIDSTKIMITIGFVGAGLAMYLFAKEYLPKVGALVASVAYIYAPYHSVDLYVRGALPEFWSFVFVPLLFWSVLKIYKKQRVIYVIVFGIVAALSILTHDLISMMCAPFLAAFFIYLLIQSERKKLFVIQITAGSVLGFLLPAYFWLPAILEKKYTMVNLLTQQLANYGLHFVCLKQFWNGAWGYGGSILGCNDGLSFQIGQAQLLLLAVTLVLLCIKILRLRKIENSIFILFMTMFIFSLYIQVSRSKFVWDNIQPFWYIQFPWRFLIFSDFTISFLIGFIFFFIKNNKFHLIFSVLSIIVLLYFNLGYFKPRSYLNVSDNYYTNTYFLRFVTSNMSFEYVPKGIATITSSIGNTIPAINKNDIAKSVYTVISGNMKIKVLQNKPQQKTFLINASNNGIFQINAFSFPGWKVYLNKRQINFSDNNKLKLIRVNIPHGEYVINAVFEETLVREIGDYISLVSFILILLFLLVKLKFKYGRH